MGNKIKSGSLNNKTTPHHNQRPPMYEIFILADSESSHEFISYIIKNVFHKNAAYAIKSIKNMNNGHNILCGSYTRDVAETKKAYIEELAQGNRYSLECIMQEGEKNAVKES
jgi:ATP-dependent Clp protease adaptor protein ClpS